MWSKPFVSLRINLKDMDNSKPVDRKNPDLEFLEQLAFRMGKASESGPYVPYYADTSEECECFSF